MESKNDFIKRIELELLIVLSRYVIPGFNRKIRMPFSNKHQSLESIISSKPKIEVDDVKKLETAIAKNTTAQIESHRKTDADFITYSINMAKKSGIDGSCSFQIKYEENNFSEEIEISSRKGDKEIYSSKIIKAHLKDILPYSVFIKYELRNGKESLEITYKEKISSYLKKHIENKKDFSQRVHLKPLTILPANSMGSVLGFTYIGENFMARRADLTGKTARMVDIHESIHTPDEYETRCLTLWIMSRERSKYIK